MDRDNVHIDNEFTDHSWQEMSKLLDQEMPVKKRKKRLIWIWFLGLGLMGLIGFSYFQLTNQPKLKSLPIPANTKKIANKSNNKKGTHPFSSSNQSIKKDSNQSIKKDSNQSISTKSSDNTSVISTIKKPLKLFPAAVNTPTAVGIGHSVPAKNDFVEIKALPKLEKSSLNTSIKNQSVPEKLNFQFIPIASLSPDLLKINNKEVVIPILPIKNKLKWRFGIYASVLNPKLGSFRSGVQANIIFNPKWSLHFGLGYAKRISSTTSISNINNDQGFSSPIPDVMMEAEDMTTTTSSPGTGTTMVMDPAEIDLIPSQGINFSNFHYFEIPLLVNYRIQSKLSLEFGGNFSYLYGYRYQFNEASYFTNNPILENTISATRFTDLSLANPPTISRINYSLIGGANYQLSPNLTAFTSYHYSSPYLKATTDSTPDKKRWQQMEVGIRYYFK